MSCCEAQNREEELHKRLVGRVVCSPDDVHEIIQLLLRRCFSYHVSFTHWQVCLIERTHGVVWCSTKAFLFFDSFSFSLFLGLFFVSRRTSSLACVAALPHCAIGDIQTHWDWILETGRGSSSPPKRKVAIHTLKTCSMITLPLVASVRVVLLCTPGSRRPLFSSHHPGCPCITTGCHSRPCLPARDR